MLFLILWTESQAAFRVLWLRRWFRVAFWISLLVGAGSIMEMQS